MSTDEPRNSGPTAEGRDPKGRFAQGNSGRPVGTRHKITRAVETLLEGDAENLTRKVIEMALAGDTTALRLCLERILPPAKSRTVHVDLPEIKRATDGLEALNAIVRAVSSGDISVDEAASMASLIEVHRKGMEIVGIEDRLTQLEQSVKSR